MPTKVQPCQRSQQQWTRGQTGTPCMGGRSWPPHQNCICHPLPYCRGCPHLCALQRSHTHTPGAPSQQGLSNSSHVSPHSTLTTPQEGRHTGLKARPEGQPPSVDHAWDHMVQLLGQAEQGGSRVPARLPAATSSALPPPSLCAEPWGARWLSGLPTSSDPAGEGDREHPRDKHPGVAASWAWRTVRNHRAEQKGVPSSSCPTATP